MSTLTVIGLFIAGWILGEACVCAYEKYKLKRYHKEEQARYSKAYRKERRQRKRTEKTLEDMEREQAKKYIDAGLNAIKQSNQ